MNSNSEAIIVQTDDLAKASWIAFQQYRKVSLKGRAHFLRTIAGELETIADRLLVTAGEETHLEGSRLRSELTRTQFQLTSYAQACEEGAWLDIRIDTADEQRQPPRPDIRKMLVPLGPVVVFGASNFPFAYSTAGGDTACALAAGCPVILKAHPAHRRTSALVAAAVQTAADRCDLPSSVFIHFEGEGLEGAQALVKHPLVKAVAFTGSFEGGKALFDIAARRPEPIPVFAEMGSINPVFILPQSLKSRWSEIAEKLAASITQSVGQFCTNPGLIVVPAGEALQLFINELRRRISDTQPQPMLHTGIANAFHQKRSEALQQMNVEVAAQTAFSYSESESIPTLAITDAASFIQNPVLHREVFGPYSLLVVCDDMAEMFGVAKSLEGQLTTTLWASDAEIKENFGFVEIIQHICGRIILNGIPTGVEVCLSMQHGGPFPATTDSRFTAVGADGIKRFARPLAFQGWPDHLLPVELQYQNPLQIWRTVNNEFKN